MYSVEIIKDILNLPPFETVCMKRCGVDLCLKFISLRPLCGWRNASQAVAHLFEGFTVTIQACRPLRNILEPVVAIC